jgi:hypothetical protein
LTGILFPEKEAKSVLFCTRLNTLIGTLARLTRLSATIKYNGEIVIATDCFVDQLVQQFSFPEIEAETMLCRRMRRATPFGSLGKEHWTGWRLLAWSIDKVLVLLYTYFA